MSFFGLSWVVMRAGGDENLRGWDEGGWRERILKEVTGKEAFQCQEISDT